MSRSPALTDIAALVHRLAVLLGAGVAPARAWRYASRPPLDGVAALVADAPQAGVADAIAAMGSTPTATSVDPDPHRRAPPTRRARDPAITAAWSGLAAIWSVSAAAGAPLADTLRSYAELLRGFAVAERETRIALGGPQATSRLVLVLPAVAIVFGALLGQDTIGVLVGTPLGWACIAVGGGLMLAGWAWTRHLLRRAAAPAGLPGLAEELTAVAMRGGVSVARARTIVGEALERYRIATDASGADATLALAAASGAPPGELLRAEAEELRRSAVADTRERAERLSVTLMLPLGICVLPAFIAVGIVPMMAAIVGSTLAVV